MKKNILTILIALICSLTACSYKDEKAFDIVSETKSSAKISINRKIEYSDVIYKDLSKVYIKNNTIKYNIEMPKINTDSIDIEDKTDTNKINETSVNDIDVEVDNTVEEDKNTDLEVEQVQILDGTYIYCPSTFLDEAGLHSYYCSNSNPYQIIDSIYYSDVTCNSDSTIEFINRLEILSPTPGSWDSVHVCDPSIVSGNFYYQGTQYKYLMAYLGCSTTDNQQNQIGFAVSNNLTNGWIKIASNPIVSCNYDSNYSEFQWGVGQPSLINLDGAGHVLLFYTEGTYNLTCTKVQEWDLSNLDTPTLITATNLSNNGTNDFISNADFALSNNTLYMVCDTHPFGGNLLNCVPDTSTIYSCARDGSTESLNSVTWNKITSLDVNTTGFQKNHNCGLYRTLQGTLASNKCIYTSASEKDNFIESLCTYRLNYLDW